jgi:hypothetical protein
MAFANAVFFRATSAGSVDFVGASAITGYRNLSGAGLTNAATYSYRAESDDKTEWEIGYGAYNSGTTTLARTTIIASSNAGSKVTFTAAPKVMLAPLRHELEAIETTANGAIQSSLLTTRGDIIYRNATVPARLAKGTQYQVMQAGANDPEYGAVNLAQAAAVTGVLPAANLPDASKTAEGIVELIVASEYRAGTDSTRALVTDEVWTAAAFATLTDAATIATDLSTLLTLAECALGGNRTMGDPSNAKVGQFFCFKFTAVTSTRTLTLHADYKLATGVEAGPYSITTAQTLYLCGFVESASVLRVTAVARY